MVNYFALTQLVGRVEAEHELDAPIAAHVEHAVDVHIYGAVALQPAAATIATHEHRVADHLAVEDVVLKNQEKLLHFACRLAIGRDYKNEQIDVVFSDGERLLESPKRVTRSHVRLGHVAGFDYEQFVIGHPTCVIFARQVVSLHYAFGQSSLTDVSRPG